MDLRCKTYVMRRCQFISAKTKDNRQIRVKFLLTKMKRQEPAMLSFLIFSANVMILGVLNNERDACLLISLLRVNAADYKDVLEMIVMPWLENVHLPRKPFAVSPR